MKVTKEEMKWRESMIKLAKKQGVSKAARKYRVNRSTVYRWLKRYDGTLMSLRNKSTRPHYHPNQHTKAEIKLIKDMYKRNVDTGLVVFWIKLKQRGYERSISGLYHRMKKTQRATVRNYLP